jgi:hypothetical protein
MDAMNNTITSGNTIKIEGGTYLPIHFEPKAPRPDPEQFVQYEYPLHNQLPSTEDVSTAAEGEASTTESSQGATNDTTFTISSIRSLDANVYPWDRIDSDSVSSIRVMYIFLLSALRTELIQTTTVNFSMI